MNAEARSVEQAIIAALAQMQPEQGDDELAYLALTSKVEHPFRDRLAYRLHTMPELKDLLVAREWRRVDLAILGGSAPLALIELKAMYTFDAKNQLDNFLRLMSGDMDKIKIHMSPETKTYNILLATHLSGQVDEHLREVVKYWPGINRGLKGGSADQVLRDAQSQIEKGFDKHDVIAAGKVTGASFEFDVSVLYWLVRSKLDVSAACG